MPFLLPAHSGRGIVVRLSPGCCVTCQPPASIQLTSTAPRPLSLILITHSHIERERNTHVILCLFVMINFITTSMQLLRKM